ncbi:60S ribosomal protein L18 [Tupaia chinensis]|uniref:60S ribosomal protein L18 n=1 Tax=Tupaia chinensis TaxID=246437 RepID=L9KU41_TUPCH|nr:60S ribosomal protein L18 [Tupaia chinensis]
MDHKVRRKEPKSQDIYLRLLVKLYRFLARQTNATFNQVVLKRLFRSRTNWPPLSLSRMIHKIKLPGRENKMAVVLGTITDDVHSGGARAEDQETLSPLPCTVPLHGDTEEKLLQYNEQDGPERTLTTCLSYIECDSAAGDLHSCSRRLPGNAAVEGEGLP